MNPLFRIFPFLFCLLLLVSPYSKAEEVDAYPKALLAARNANCLSGFSKQDVLNSLTNPPIVLLFGVMSLMAMGGDAAFTSNLLTDSMQEDFRKLAEIEKDTPIDAMAVERILVKLRVGLGPVAYESVVGNVLASGTRAAQVLDLPNNPYDPVKDGVYEDLMEMRRKWGVKLLPENDEIFFDPKYLAWRARFNGVSGLFFEGNREIEDSATQIFEEWQGELFRLSSEDLQLLEFYLTGSDANNGLLDIATYAAKQYEVIAPGGNPNRKIDRARILVFQGSYVAVRGEFKKYYEARGRGLRIQDEMIPGPQVKPNELEALAADPNLLKEQEEKEKRSLDFIREQVTAARKDESKVPVGGILIETLLGTDGMQEYRPEYLTQLRMLCDELVIPLFADEVLTGGGRTGKFFGYQHFPGFQPDFVTFGKGLQMSGILFIQRSNRQVKNKVYKPLLSGGVTLRQYAEPLLKSLFILKRIRKDKLIENAAEVGAYFKEKLKQYFAENYPAITIDLRGRGLLLSSGVGMGLLRERADYRLLDASDRLMPYLSLTKKEVDLLFTRLKKKRVSED